ncbi:hypothetical protein M430DRAFT_103618 [Amorphotheca resinae ATCC 22711]|uniref:Diphthamide biosynthesis protein 4 n=1 Tax=Amorphotheca resinae ATCC 22711 TaxID=857342 RepID=A0A2T3B0Q0_AMORE|nr:hypothetical protein M430DRAFT_103618 [Amorphotheca resinae ATCC 22711]PSS16970.1 hypothetical protein M430DRAFT_103618 [Amorphotheca resinae ATCC 22711]
MTRQTTATHYEILGLPPPLPNEPPVSAQTLRAAYRRALLRHHPDKCPSKPALNPVPGETLTYTVDQITLAFSTLSDPKARAAYDASLALDRAAATRGLDGGKEGREWKTGIETVDLDDLEGFEEGDGEQVWFRGCRCGDERGFMVREGDLEDAVQEGEVTVGCKGCSLWLKVQFGVVEDGEGG